MLLLFILLRGKTGVHGLFDLQIWELVERKQNQLTRAGLYKALALIALAQQGKTINDKVLQNYSGDQGKSVFS